MSLLGSLMQRPSFAPGRWLALPGWRRTPLRLRLSLLAAIMSTPALILLGFMTVRSIAAEQLRIEENLQRIATQIRVEIEREIEVTAALLSVLATSHNLQTGGFDRFHERASEISRQLGVEISLHFPRHDGRLITTASPFQETPEATFSAVAEAAEQQALATGKPVVSGVFPDPIGKRLMVAAIMAVKQNNINLGPNTAGDPVISIAIPVSKFAKILENAPPGEGRLVSLIDENTTIIARSEQSEAFAGLKSLPTVFKLLAKTGGIVDIPSRDGVTFHSLFRYLPSLGWTVIVGEQLDQLRASSRRTIVMAATAGTTMFALAVGFAYSAGRRLEQKVGTLGIDRNPTREEFALLFDSAPNGVLLVDDQGLVLLANAQLEQTFGYAPKELAGKPIETLMPVSCRSAHAAHREHFARHPAARTMGNNTKLRGLHKNGVEFPIEVRLQPIIIQAQHYTIATVIDISARNLAAAALARAEAERDRLRRELMRSSDEERLKLSHELHDQTGQTLTAAALAAKDVEKYVDTEGRNRLEVLNALLDQMGETLHHVAWQLRPTSIDELGLRATLKTYVSDWTDKTGIGADFYCENLDALASDVQTTIYRVTQEALTNVIKHAPQASWVSVVISRSDTLLRLTIEDNGNGFDIAEQQDRISQHRSLGIAGMRERLSLIGGTLDIESSPGNGTTLFARIPLEPAAESL